MKIYEVGGAVRNLLLGKIPNDIDYVVIGATPEEMLQRGFICVGKTFPVFLHPVTHAEYALARKETKTGEKHTDFAFEFSPNITLSEDLLRRDFTCNALAKDPENGKIIDEVGGIADIKNKTLRHICAEHFVEDPLRVLRMCRFAAQLNFTIADETMELAKKMTAAKMLEKLSPDRFRDEFFKALRCVDFLRFIEAMRECGALKLLLPNFNSFFEDNENRLNFEYELNLVKNESEIIKFAILFRCIDEQKIREDCRKIRMSERFYRFAVLLNHQSKYFASHTNITAEYLFDLLKENGKFRDYTPIQELFVCLKKLQINYGTSEKITAQIFSLCNEFKVSELPDFASLPKTEIIQQKYKEYILQKLI